MRPALLLAVALALAGCLPSTLLAPEDRLAPPPGAAEAFAPFSGDALSGYYASRSIEGAVAATLLRVCYWFEPDGSFTGAALVATDPPSFQVLSGTWRLDGAELVLGEGAPPARLDSAPGLLRLTGEQGVVVLEQQPL